MISPDRESRLNDTYFHRTADLSAFDDFLLLITKMNGNFIYVLIIVSDG